MKIELLTAILLASAAAVTLAGDRTEALPVIGFTVLQTDLPGTRHANVRTMRAVVVRTDGTQRQLPGEQLANEPDAWTQFAGWSPDGAKAIVLRCWQDPANAIWEEEHSTFRMEPGKWLVDTCLIDMSTGSICNVTAVDRISHYNSGVFFLPDGRGLGFTPLIDGVSKPFVMDLDGRHKRDVSGPEAGFAYGYSASPDGQHISYHQDYQIYVAKADGSEKQHVKTGHAFDFAPRWSPDGEWLLFVSGEHYDCHPYIVRRNGSDLRKLADRAGYRGVTEFLDVWDFHGGSSDLPVWSVDGHSIFYTAAVGTNIELFQVALTGQPLQITNTPSGSTHYHPTPSADGKYLLYGSKRDGVRQLMVINLADRSERQITDITTGHAAMWPHWQPSIRVVP